MSESLEAAICRLLGNITINIERVEGNSASRILRYFETEYSVSLKGISEFESLGDISDNYGRRLENGMLMSETVEGRPTSSSLLRAVHLLKPETDNIYIAMKALVTLLLSLVKLETGIDFFKFLALFKIILERDKLVASQIISLFLPPFPSNAGLQEKINCLFQILKISRSQQGSLDDYIGRIASTGPIEITGFGPTPMYFGRNGNNVFVSTPTTFGDFASRTPFQPHGTMIHNISTDATWMDLLKSRVIAPKVYEDFDCTPYYDSCLQLAEAGVTQQELRRMSKDFANEGEYQLALSCRVAADIMICCENNTSMVDTGLLLKINPAGKVWNHEGAISKLLSLF